MALLDQSAFDSTLLARRTAVEKWCDKNQSGSRSIRLPVGKSGKSPIWANLELFDDKSLIEFRDEINRILVHIPDATLGPIFTWLMPLLHQIDVQESQ